MKKFTMVTPETLNKLGKCFSGVEEVTTFITQMDGLANEITFNVEMRKRIQEDQSAIMLLKQVCFFTLFCREHLDLIHQLIKNLECKEMTEEEIKKMMEQG